MAKISNTNVSVTVTILVHCRWEGKMVEPMWHFHIKLNIGLLFDPAIMLLDIYSNERTIYVHTKICT